MIINMGKFLWQTLLVNQTIVMQNLLTCPLFLLYYSQTQLTFSISSFKINSTCLAMVTYIAAWSDFPSLQLVFHHICFQKSVLQGKMCQNSVKIFTFLTVLHNKSYDLTTQYLLEEQLTQGKKYRRFLETVKDNWWWLINDDFWIN